MKIADERRRSCGGLDPRPHRRHALASRGSLGVPVWVVCRRFTNWRCSPSAADALVPTMVLFRSVGQAMDPAVFDRVAGRNSRRWVPGAIAKAPRAGVIWRARASRLSLFISGCWGLAFRHRFLLGARGILGLPRCFATIYSQCVLAGFPPADRILPWAYDSYLGTSAPVPRG